MPDYRLTGKYFFAPDRGSPKGNKEPFTEEFEAADDVKAREWVRAFRSTHVKIVSARLVRIKTREKTVVIGF